MTVLLAAVLFHPVMVQAQPAEEVERAARQLLEGISMRDTTLSRAVLAPEAQIISLANRDGQPAYRARSVEAFLQSLAGGGSALLERMWEPEVRIDGPLASVWTRYDFYVDGAFSHCGTDAFHLAQTPDGWKIMTIIYTVEPDPTKCPESPLGPPE